jgi:hypothetical protein
MASLNYYKYVNPGGVRDKNLEQVTINAQKFLIRKSDSKKKPSVNDNSNAINSFSRKMILGVNRLGGSINSSIDSISKVNENLKETNKSLKQSYIKSNSFYNNFVDNQKKTLELRKKQEERELNEESKRKGAESESKVESLSKKESKSSMMGSVVKKAGGGILDFFANLIQLFLKTAITMGVLKWFANPENTEKIGKFFIALREIVKFIAKVIEFGVVNVIEGLVKLIDGNILQKIVGIFQFLIGAFTLFVTIRWLKNPLKIIKDLRTFFNILKVLPAALKSAALLAKSIALAAKGGGWRAGLAQFRGKRNFKTSSGQTKLTPRGRDEYVNLRKQNPDMPASDALKQVRQSDNPVVNSNAPNTTQQFAVGGIAKGPDTGYNVTLHGTEAIIPLDNRFTKSGGNPFENILPKMTGGIGNILGSSNILGGEAGRSKQAQSLSDGMRLPFKAVGAALIANLGSTINSLGPVGDLVRPFVQEVVVPIANSYGVPSSIVNLVVSKEKIDQKVTKPKSLGKGGTKDDGLRKTIGEGNKSIKKVEGSKWQPGSDMSVRGLLASIASGMVYLNDKLGAGASSPSSSSSSDPSSADSVTQTPGSTGGGASGSPTNTAQETIKKAGGMREDGTLQGIKGTVKDKGRSGKEYSPGAGLMPVEGGNRKYWYNSSGDVFMWEKSGDPLTDLTSAGDKSMISSKVLGGPMVRDLKDGKVKIIKGMFGGDQTPVGYYSYEMGSILKKRGESGQGRSKTGATKDQWEKPADGRYGPTITPKEPPKKAAGGWISGPHSGYPVSLDGGRSIAFEGHGTEWVGFKKAAGGNASSAFVIPFDTPKTKNNPRLTEKRMKEAKSGGFVMPFDGGGEYTPDGKPKDSRIKKRLENTNNLMGFSSGGLLSKLGDGSKLANAPRGMCTTGVLETMSANGVPNPPATGSDGNNPRGLMVQMIKNYGWGSMPYGKPINLNSPYGKVGANMMNFDEWKKNVKANNIPSGSLVFSTRNSNWNSNGPSSGHDSAIAKQGGRKLWSGHWQSQTDGVGAVYGSGTRSIVALTPGGSQVKYDPSKSPDDPSDPSSSPESKPQLSWDQQLAQAITGVNTAWTDENIKMNPLEGIKSADKPVDPKAIKPGTKTTPTGSQVQQQSQQLRQTKSQSNTKADVVNTGSTNAPKSTQSTVSAGTIVIPASGSSKGSTTDFLLPMGHPGNNFVSPQGLSHIK